MRAGTFAIRMTLTVDGIASRSTRAGLQGINTISAAVAASRAAVSVCGAVSMMARVAPVSFALFMVSANLDTGVVTTKRRISLHDDFLHFAADACGSRSIKITVCPDLSASTAR